MNNEELDTAIHNVDSNTATEYLMNPEKIKEIVRSNINFLKTKIDLLDKKPAGEYNFLLFISNQTGKIGETVIVKPGQKNPQPTCSQFFLIVSKTTKFNTIIRYNLLDNPLPPVPASILPISFRELKKHYLNEQIIFQMPGERLID